MFLILKLEITDITGRKLKTVALSGTKGGKAIIPTTGFSNGVVICRYYVEGA